MVLSIRLCVGDGNHATAAIVIFLRRSTQILLPKPPMPSTPAMKLRGGNNESNSFGGNLIQLDTLVFIVMDVPNHRRRSLLSDESGNDVDLPW